MDYVKGNSMGTQVWPLETINERAVQYFFFWLDYRITVQNQIDTIQMANLFK